MQQFNKNIFAYLFYGRFLAIGGLFSAITTVVAILGEPVLAQEERPVLVSPDGSDAPPTTGDQDASGEDAASGAAEETVAQTPGGFTDEITRARERFEAVSEDQLAEARSELQRRMNDLERAVRPSSENGRKWLGFLRWDALREALETEGLPPLEPLAETYRRLNRNEAGLELSPFRRMSDALRRYLDLVAVARLDNPQEAYGRQLDALAQDLERYREQSSPQLEQRIGNRLDFLAGVGQADELLQAVRREYSRPNAFIYVAEDLLNAAAAEPIDRSDPVTDNILGTRINGTAHTSGAVSLRTVPSEERARLELISNGHSVSDNVGRNGPAVICSTGYTDYTATKLVELEYSAFRSRPARVSAQTRSDIHSVSKAGGGLGSRIVARVGQDRARQRQGQTNAIAADHAEDRIARRINDEVAEELRDARRQYEEEFRQPLVRRGELPPYIRFSTTDDAMNVVATQASRSQLGAPSGPPPLAGPGDLTARLHQTAINNYVASVLGGATVRENDPDKDAEFDVELPDWMQRAWEERQTEFDGEGENQNDDSEDNEAFQPYLLTFRRGRPISVDLEDGDVTLTIHVDRMVSGEDEFEDWDITGTFQPQLADGGVMLRRDGDLEVLPTGFDRERDQLSQRQVAVRSNLTKVLNERSAEGRGFPRTIEIDRLEPEGDWEKVGPLNLEEFTSDDGWLALAWNRIRPERTARSGR